MTLASFIILAGLAAGGPVIRDDWFPTVKDIQVIGNMADPSIDRDSCGAARFGPRLFWTCRDSQPYDGNGNPITPIWSSSASWSNFDSSGTPQTQMYGGDGSQTPYFPYASDECGGSSAGDCGDNTRYAIWPDQPPLVASSDNNQIVSYTWIRNMHLSGLDPVDPDPATSLYKVTYDLSTSDQNALPQVQMLDENFWPANGIPYGSYGQMIKDGTAYLWGRPSNSQVGLARVPAASIEDKTKYEYYVNGAWASQMPGKDDNTYNIVNAGAGGQGTFFFSSFFNKFMWVGQAGLSVSAAFQVTTADAAEGPWAKPVDMYRGQDGTYKLAAYTLQAHPEMSASGNADTDVLYISYTKNDAAGDMQKYSTPLIKITWNPK